MDAVAGVQDLCSCRNWEDIRIITTITGPPATRECQRRSFKCGVVKKTFSRQCSRRFYNDKVVRVRLLLDPLLAGILLRNMSESDFFLIEFSVWTFEQWKIAKRKKGKLCSVHHVINGCCSLLFEERTSKVKTGLRINHIIGLLPPRTLCLEPDIRWSRRLMPLLIVFIQLSDIMAWLSTLGGAYSSLGDHSLSFSQKAGEISMKQLLVASKLKNPVLTAQCKVFMAMSLVQRGCLKQATHIIRKQHAFALSNGAIDDKLLASSKAVWNRIRYVKQQRKALKLQYLARTQSPTTTHMQPKESS